MSRSYHLAQMERAREEVRRLRAKLQIQVSLNQINGFWVNNKLTKLLFFLSFFLYFFFKINTLNLINY